MVTNNGWRLKQQFAKCQDSHTWLVIAVPCEPQHGYEVQISSRHHVSFSVLRRPVELASLLGCLPSRTKAQTLQAEPRILEWLIFISVNTNAPSVPRANGASRTLPTTRSATG